MARFGTTSLACVAAMSILAGTLAAPAPARAATTRHVPADYATIQAAIDASDPGDTVLVAPGTYSENIVIDEGLTLESSGGADVTTIDSAANGYPVVTLNATVGEAPIVRGFTITDGWYAYGGAGLSIAGGGEPVIEHNRIVGNHGGGGSGIYAYASSPTIQDNLIADNTETATSGGRGGGIALIGAGAAIVRRNVITGNSATGGGAISLNGAGTPTIDRNVISDNSAGAGGGIELFNDTSPVVTNNVIAGNTATSYGGGGIYWGSGSGLGTPSLVNNTVAANTGSPGSAIILTVVGPGVVVRNNAFSGSGSDAVVACPQGATATFTNNNAWNPVGPEYLFCPAYTGSDGNVSVDPKHLAPASDDFHLRPDSPLIDAGTSTDAPTTDVDGESRPHDGDESGGAQVDIGADEATDPLLVDPASIDFGELALSVPSAMLNITVANYGAAPLEIDTVDLQGTAAADFETASDGCTNETLTAGEACTIGVVFTAAAVGDRTAELRITGPGAVGTRTAALSGAGLDPVGISPTAVNFGSVAAGGTDTPVTVTVTNAGAADFTVTGVSVSGTNAAEFPITSQTCMAAPVNTSCTVVLGFTPKATGARSATLSITGPQPVGNREVGLSGTGTAPPSGVSWGTTYKAGGAYTWSGGNALGRTVQSGTQRLHVAYATDRIGDRWAKDGGPYVGVYYTRATSGSTWSAPKRLNPSSQHAPFVGLAASGSGVYATWVTYAKWIRYSPAAPRVLYVRRNTNHGSASAWKSTIRLTSTSGRVDYPVIAASGNDVHIAYTDSDTGSVRLATSRDRGATWTKQTVGLTTRADAAGYTGHPTVAVDGSTVVVTWLSSNAGALSTRTSTNRAITWGSAEAIGAEANGYPSVAVLGGRTAVSWTTADEVVVRQRVSGTWGTAKVVANLGTHEDVYPFASVVKLNGSSRIGVAWAHRLNSEDWTNLRWAESADGGNVWFSAQTIAAYNTTSARVRNDWASVVWASAGTRYVLWNGYNNNYSNYRQYLRKGSGTPASPSAPAADWVPDGDLSPLPRQPGSTRGHGVDDHPSR